MAELSEAEEQHEIGEYIDYVGYDFRGSMGRCACTINGTPSGASAK